MYEASIPFHPFLPFVVVVRLGADLPFPRVGATAERPSDRVARSSLYLHSGLELLSQYQKKLLSKPS